MSKGEPIVSQSLNHATRQEENGGNSSSDDPREVLSKVLSFWVNHDFYKSLYLSFLSLIKDRFFFFFPLKIKTTLFFLRPHSPLHFTHVS